MRIVWFLPPEPLQPFIVKEGLHPKIVIDSKSLELLGQGEVCEDHVMDLNLSGLISSNWKSICPRIPVVLMGIHPQISLESA